MILIPPVIDISVALSAADDISLIDSAYISRYSISVLD